MSRKHAAAVIAVKTEEPSESVSHRLFRITREAQQRDRMTVGLQLEGARIASGNNSPGDWSQCTATWENLLQKRDSQANSRADDLGFSGMAKIFMSDLAERRATDHPSPGLIVR